MQSVPRKNPVLPLCLILRTARQQRNDLQDNRQSGQQDHKRIAMSRLPRRNAQQNHRVRITQNLLRMRGQAEHKENAISKLRNRDLRDHSPNVQQELNQTEPNPSVHKKTSQTDHSPSVHQEIREIDHREIEAGEISPTEVEDRRETETEGRREIVTEEISPTEAVVIFRMGVQIRKTVLNKKYII